MTTSATDSRSEEANAENLPVRYRYLLLTGMGLLLYIACIGLRDLWYPDEPDVAEVAKAMFLSGDWIAPRRMGVIWVDYPPLVYWAGSISSHLFGEMTAFSLRLPSALAAIGLVLLTCLAGSRWFGPAAGFWSGVLLLLFPQFALQAIGYRPDMLFSLFIGLGLFLYASGSGDSVRWGLRAAGFACFGLAMLTKGPLGLLLPGLVLTLWHALRREWRSLFALAPLSLISVAMYLAWFIVCARQMGGETILNELWLQNVARFGSGFRGHRRHFFYYAVSIWYDMAPWIFLLPPALWGMVQKRSWQNRNYQLLLWWCGVFFVFLSIAATKRQLYLLPAYPAFALLTGHWIASTLRARTNEQPTDLRWACWFVIAVAVLLFAAGGSYVIAGLGGGFVIPRLGLATIYESVALNLLVPGFALGVLALAAGFWILAAWRRGDLSSGFVRIAGALFGLYLAAFAWFMPSFDPVKTYAPAGEWLRTEIDPGTPLGLAFPPRGDEKMGAFAFYSDRMVELLESPGAIENFLREHPNSVVLLAKNAVKRIYGKDRTDWQDNVVRELLAGRYEYFVLKRKG